MGVSQSSLQLMEQGRRKILRPFALKVSAFSGCKADDLMMGKALDLGGEPYSKKSYDYWVTTPISADNAGVIARRLGQACEFVVRSAISGTKGPESNPYRFREVASLLTQAIGDVLEQFNLLDGLNAKLAEGVSAGDWKKVTLGQARKEYRNTKGWDDIDNHEVDKSKPIKIRTTINPVWNPIFGDCVNIEPGNFAKGNLKIQKKVEIQVPWRRDIVVIWFTGLYDPASREIIEAISRKSG